MTFTAELAKPAQRLEYVLCIEGMGWPVDAGDLSAGFVGDVFVSADQAGALASVLSGATIHRGLRVASVIEESLDPRTLAYNPGSMSFEIIDDGYLEANFSPHRESDETTLSAVLYYESTTLRLADGANFAQNDVIFVGGREAIKLGAKALVSGTEYEYTGCARAHLGTPRGANDIYARASYMLAWWSGASVFKVNRFWKERRVLLIGHVPGESAANLSIQWRGRLRKGTTRNSGPVWSLGCGGERALGRDVDRMLPLLRLANNYWRLFENPFNPGSPVPPVYSQTDGFGGDLPVSYINSTRRVVELVNSDADYGDHTRFPGNSAIAASYQYRTEPGGTEGMLAGVFDPTAIQARDTTMDDKVNYSLLAIGDQIMRAIKAADIDTPVNFKMLCEVTPETSALAEPGAPVRILLDNFSDHYELSRFTINNQVTRNVVDLMLMFLTTMPSEFWRGDATGGTAAAPQFSASWATNLWAGKALHCVEGSNKGFARVIASNTADTITLVEAFPNAPTAGTEYQVRNTIYDVLPLGWGCGYDSSEIDVASFEGLRDEYLGHADVAPFAIGAQEKINLWRVVVEDLARPHRVLIYVNRTTGKLSARWLGDAADDGVLETYESIAQSKILRLGEVDWSVAKPVGLIKLEVRRTESVPVRIERIGGSMAADANIAVMGERPVFDALNGDTTTIEVKPRSIEHAYNADDTETVEIKARFQTLDTADHVIQTATAHIIRYAVPPPEVDLEIHVSETRKLAVGALVLLNDSRGVNPFTGARGWSSLVARIISVRLPTMTGGALVQVRAQLLKARSIGRIAPAAIISAITYDAGLAKWYVTAEDTNFVVDTVNDKDWHHFAVGDKLRVRNRNGAVQGTSRRIVYFGSNQSATPEGASDSRIYLDGDPSATWAAGFHVTFDTWIAGTGAERQAKYSHWADADGVLGSSDPAKEYA